MTFESEFNFGDRVLIDNGTVAGVAVGFCFYPHGNQVQVSWWKDGVIVEQWIGAWRLTKETEPESHYGGRRPLE
jgi:hypothetical protein